MTKETWRATMLKKYGSEQGIKDEMARRAYLSALSPSRQKGRHKGGFNYMDKATLKDFALQTAAKKRAKRDNKPNETH